MTIVFNNGDLLPEAWKAAAEGHAVRAFNPALVRYGTGWVLAYRVVIEPGRVRHIAACRLDERFAIIPHSQVPLSDWFAFEDPDQLAPQALTWFADPRLHYLAGRLFIYWNSGWHEPQNHQFLQELDRTTLRPIGSPRELRLAGRNKLEKNWGIFEAGGAHAVYSVNPHRVLSFQVSGSGPLEFANAAAATPNPAGYAQVHGGLRGGSPPVHFEGHFYSFCHSIENGPDGYQYVPAVYQFAASAPFLPTAMPLRPLAFAIPRSARRQLPRLNPAIADVVYPAGAAFESGSWIISFGIDDERCAITVLDHATVLDSLGPTAAAFGGALR